MTIRFGRPYVLNCLICDEFLVAVGQSDDTTLALIQGIGSPKIRIIETVWDDALRANGEVLALETNRALRAISPDSDWCFYIQGDEVLEEGQDSLIRRAMEPLVMRERIEAMNWSFNTDISMERRILKDRIKDALLLIGINPNYVNYKKVGTFDL